MGPTRVMDEEIDLSLSLLLSLSSFLVDDDFSRGPISRLSCFPEFDAIIAASLFILHISTQ